MLEPVQFIPPSQRRVAVLASQSDSAAVLIKGAQGTGKGALARWIHLNSIRNTKPFVVYSPENPLVPQILAAQGGTLFIEEIGSTPMGQQKVLNDWLSSKSLPHPDNAGVKVIVTTRLMTGTSQDLENRVHGGLFNSDLFKKITTFLITMPQLSEREEEFSEIADAIMKEITHELHKEHVRGFSEEAMKALKAHTWPGNLRELRNVLRVGVIRCTTDLIEANDLPDIRTEPVDFHATREKFEKIYLQELLKTFNWNLDRVSEISRISKSLLEDRIKKFQLKK